MRLSWHLPLAVCPERKKFTSAFFEVLHALEGSAYAPYGAAIQEVTQPSSESVWVGVTPGSGRREVGVGPGMPSLRQNRGQTGSRLPAASCWKGSPAHSSMPATAALELNMARILIFFVV